jgi:predicted heme/steroid binding protein
MARRRSSGGGESEGGRRHSPRAPAQPVPAGIGSLAVGGRPQGHRRIADAVAGLNLNAAVLLVPALYRAGKPIAGEEFANVAGRAGRAFVDVEGLIVHVMFDRVDWRSGEWRGLVASSKARTLKSGLIQIVAEILERLGREGVLARADAREYLANAREAWRSPAEEAARATQLAAAPDAEAEPDDDDEDDEAGGDEEESIEEEPLSELVERLAATVFGLVEALDADRADLPKLLDEALKGSLWARQIVREGEGVETQHRKVFEARANLIWSVTTPQARRGHFAMGVGLEAGLTIDAMPEELGDLIDRADAASLPGDVDELANALAGLGERLLVMRPFIPDKNNALPDDWKAILKQWVSGAEVSQIGLHNMRIVEEAFTYRLVWALEAIRTRRLTLGWSPDIIPGGAAASMETGVPQFMMSMLIRAGLPSRRAAMAAIRTTNPVFVTPAEMRAWMESDVITAFTDTADWPTPDTAALWARFRTEAEAQPFSGRLPEATAVVDALRAGRGKLRWPRADA